jgi:UDP-2,4-diacetamido-2,4,6-trideoxy-beta-L-altropyranose hydrolase
MKLLVRADASPRLGVGHVMRCLALGQAWQETGGQVSFLTTAEAPALLGRLEEEGMAVSLLAAPPGSAQDASESLDMARQSGAGWIVVDGYHFGAEYQRQLKESGRNMLFIDDEGRGEHYYADLVLNQNIHAHEGLYGAREPYTRLLLGPRYALLRREFWPWKGWQRQISPVARKVLVTLGGGDPDNVTLKVIQALKQVEVPGLEARIIVGPANPHREELDREVGGDKHLQLLENAAHMPELISWADLAICAGGGTFYELAFMQLPGCVIVIAENQKLNVDYLEKQKLCLNIGCLHSLNLNEICKDVCRLIFDEKLRKEMSRKLRGTVDGLGTDRIIVEILRYGEEHGKQ